MTLVLVISLQNRKIIDLTLIPLWNLSGRCDPRRSKLSATSNHVKTALQLRPLSCLERMIDAIDEIVVDVVAASPQIREAIDLGRKNRKDHRSTRSC